MYSIVRNVALAGAVVLLGGCATQSHSPPGRYPAGSYSTAPAPVYAPAGTEYGRLQKIEVLQTQQHGQTSGVGAVAGAVVGGVLGNQVGKGSGRVAATAVGAVGGALAGNAIEQHQNSGTVVQGYRLVVQMDRGGYRSFDVGNPGDLRVGDHVRVYKGQISRY